ncbi:MAG: DASH family cryptochrome [Candidatus Sericytochromatia bacterium]|nr:DASH family cryptochrome [Candidatus Sericytochromatia bacterium]
MPVSIVWLRQDLRLADHAPLLRAVQSGLPLAFVWVEDPRWSLQDPLGFPRIGRHRRRFVGGCLAALDQELARRGHALHVLKGEPAEVLPRWLGRLGGGLIFAHREPGTEEAEQEAALERLVAVDWAWGKTLVDPADLPMPVAELPRVFTDFRRKAEPVVGRRADLAAPDLHAVAAAPRVPPETCAAWSGLGEAVSAGQGVIAEAHGRLAAYMAEGGSITRYRETRDALMGEDTSSRLSPWLASGTLSAREVNAALAAHEERWGSSEHTRWFRMELLWRDFFQFVALQQGRRLFMRSGFSGRSPVASGLAPETLSARFEAWRTGGTGQSLVDAAMRELAATGWLSNRARQLAAWYLARNLQVPWTWGARWFSSCLIDDDVASNWGNWAYLAGVGNDPRPDRHFDLAWQTGRHDPEGTYRRQWGTWTEPG